MGFEVVVRPVVLPNIRPNPARSLPPQNDPEKGFAVIRGNGFRQASTTYSLSMSASSSRPVETKRRVDKVRVYQKEDNGNINKENFIDVEATNKIWARGAKGPAVNPRHGSISGSQKPFPPSNEEKLQYYYSRIMPLGGERPDNIEMIRPDIIKENIEGQ